MFKFTSSNCYYGTRLTNDYSAVDVLIGLQCKGAYRATSLNSTELTWFSFWRTGQWASGNALHWAPSSGVGDYVTTRTYAWTNNQWLRPARLTSFCTRF